MSTTIRLATPLLRRCWSTTPQASNVNVYRLNAFKQPLGRSIATTLPRYAALAEQTPAKSTVILSTPSAAYLEKEEMEVESIPPGDVKLVITDRAATVIISFFWTRTFSSPPLSNFGQLPREQTTQKLLFE